MNTTNHDQTAYTLSARLAEEHTQSMDGRPLHDDPVQDCPRCQTTTRYDRRDHGPAPMCAYCRNESDPYRPLDRGWKIMRLADAVGADEGAIRAARAYDYHGQKWTTADHAHFHCTNGGMLYCGALLASCFPDYTPEPTNDWVGGRIETPEPAHFHVMNGSTGCMPDNNERADSIEEGIESAAALFSDLCPRHLSDMRIALKLGGGIYYFADASLGVACTGHFGPCHPGADYVEISSCDDLECLDNDESGADSSVHFAGRSAGDQ